MIRYIFIFIFFISFLHAKMIDAVAVRVGDDVITLHDITDEMRTSHVSKKQAIDILIRKKLEEAEIKKRGISVGVDEVYDEIRRLAASNHMSISQFYDVVRESNGLNSTQLKEKIKERLLSQKLYQSIAMSKMKEPSDSELQEYFKLHKNELTHPLFFDVVIYSAPTSDLLEKKLENPMFYSALISKKDQRIPYDKLSPPLAKLLNATKEGAFTQIIPNGKNGYMSFYLQKRGPQEEVKFDDVKPYIVNAVMNQKRAEILDDYFAKLKDSMDVKVLRK